MTMKKSDKKIGGETRKPLMTSASILAAAAAAISAAPALAQDEEEAIAVTGTRVVIPGVESASPITTVGSEEIAQQQQPEVERILAALPITLAADGQNRNNGTSGAATINLRGLGAQRNLIMIDGRRLVPFNAGGVVDTQQVPTAFLDRIDIVTGGASAVYGSDAIAGAINFVLKRDFEGIEFNYDRSISAENDGEINTASLNFGANVADGRGNVAVSLTYSERAGVTLGQRPLGLLGIDTETGLNYAEFLAGQGPVAPADPLCQGENVVAIGGGSPNGYPTRISLVGSAATFNALNLQQFRTDGSIGANCSDFNFNPYNYYQTPQDRFGATAIAHYEINPNVEAYGRFTFSDTSVRLQVAPSGVFNNIFNVNMDNPFIAPAIRAQMIAAAEAARAGGTVCASPTLTCTVANWVDRDSNGVVSAPDDLRLGVRRRTIEFGPRDATFNADTFQLAAGLRGQIGDSGWDYDTYISHGRVNTATINAGYSNVTNFAHQLLTTDGVTCRDNPAPCVPLNIFGPPITNQGAITYGSATAIRTDHTEQTIFNTNIAGELGGLRSPWAESAIGVSVGYEYRYESAEVVPDECLKTPPLSCLGGGGGTTLPLAGEYDVHELFAEAIIPVMQDQPLARSLDVELGYRQSDYSIVGENETYKYGVVWEPVEGLRFRAMRQRAARAPNVGELFAPIVSTLSNAVRDPCSSAQPAAQRTPALRALCESTGQTAAQVWTVDDGVSANQVPALAGSNPAALPGAELADSTTIGLVWTPDFGGSLIQNPIVTFDWYNIEIEDVIGAFGGQEVLDGCYVLGLASQCNNIVRVGGELGLAGAGVILYTTNLLRSQAEGYELGIRFGVDIGDAGALTFAFNGNQYVTQESQSATFLDPIECLGFFGNQCGNPLPEIRWTQRTTWEIGDFQFSYLWRHLGEVSAEPVQIPDTFPAFRSVDAVDYIDVSANWAMNDNVEFTLGARNVTNEEPPVLGNAAGSTSTNAGNTFPQVYDTIGRVYSMGFNLRF